MKRIALSQIQKILLTTDGSITKILEAVRGGEIKVKTEKQEVIKADKKIAKLLNIKEGDKVNYRAVNLQDSKATLVYAISYTPLKRLRREFREDIMKKDIPLGKILAKLKIEARREIKNFEVLQASDYFAEIFHIPSRSYLLKRSYNIIHNKEILLNITEIFPYEFFR